jgi:hypothetical protein
MPRKRQPTQEELRLQRERATRNKWKKENCYAMTIRFRNERDADVIAVLKETPNKVEYICKLIREDIEKD